MKKILVAINIEKNAGRLLAKAEELAQAFGSKIWILHVSEPDPDDFLGLEAGPQFAQDKRVEKRKIEGALVKRLAEDLRQKNIEAEAVQLEGSTAKMIKKEVQKINADIVIAGHHKKNFFYQMFVGSLEQDLIDDLGIPVLLVPVKH
ncbi:universal stress protein [Salinimicrobium sediminilitoris]|uniref:universal stress protein n=1 Tax=Salinimicrobium sediminilitoris TaxID=2876715 RepID=UPI001E5967FB|nr:universal stress protein [Salinimicrobium sediminilitoris]MCC8358389.1 universal stress protein [Salinimicrobium sediminilitoris]